MTMTTPVKPKTPVTKPWEPASVLTVDRKDPNYRYRWCRKDILDKKLSEGWEVVKGTAKSTEASKCVTLMDGTTLDSTVQKRELILCRMPEEMAVSRAKYYADMTDSLVAAQKDDLERLMGSSALGSIVNK